MGNAPSPALRWSLGFVLALLFFCDASTRVHCQDATSDGTSDTTSSLLGASPAPQASVRQSSPIFPIPSYLQTSGAQADNVVIEWNKAIQYIIRNNNVTNIAPRAFAFVHLAIWQALRANNDTAITPQAAPFIAVASYAAMQTIKSVLPIQLDKYDALFRFQTKGFSTSEIALAKSVAGPVVLALFSSRLGDGFQEVPAVPPTEGEPGQFLDTGTPNTMPNQAYAVTRPFLLPNNLSSWEFVANFTPPTEVPSPAYSIQYTPTYLYGDLNSSLRSADQTATAIFWADSGSMAYLTKTSGVQAQWNRVFAGTLPASLPIDVTAELMAKLNVGMFDCIVSTFYLKYQFNFWRPLTAIRKGDPDHTPDPLWKPLLQTPDSPTYPSVSGCYAGLTASLLTNYHGRDAVTFSAATENLGSGGTILPSRVFTSFSQVAVEVSQSRYFGGLEFPMDSASALDFGNEIADYLLDHWETLDIKG